MVNVLAKDKILLCGDDVIIARVLGKILKRRGYNLKIIKETENIATKVWEIRPKLVILDFDAPETDSLKLCHKLKHNSRIRHIPVIILSAEDADTKNVIKGLKAGAEDYLYKPLNSELFLAKVMVILRRRIFHEEPEEIIKAKNIILNLTKHTVLVNDNPVKLSPKEFALLYFLMKRKGRVLSRRTLRRNVWEHEYFGDMYTLNIHVHTLRKKLGEAGKYIEAIEGVGYKFKT